MIAAALLRSVLGAKGVEVMPGFHAAIVGCAAAAVLAGANAFFLTGKGLR
jgi:hypothetical protein